MSYGYDDADQLTSITYTKGGSAIGDLQYAYDAAGRRVKVSGSLARTNLPAAVGSASYNANNQLELGGRGAHTYDLNGNLTGDGTKTYTWNARDQLAGLSGGATASFSYDGAGRRKSKTVAGTQTGFVYDGLNFVQELTGTTPKANLITGGIDELFLRKETAAIRHPIADALGSIIALTDASGAMATEYTFEPYGSTTASGAADSNTQRYTGREDDGSGLYYYRARYYSPSTSRFVAEDPIGIAAGANLYGYVSGNPLKWKDPKGLVQWNGVGRSLDFGPYSRDEFTLESECKCGIKMRITVEANYLGIGGGASAMGSGASYEDNFDCPTPMAFEGPAFKVSASAGFRFGTGFNFSILGRATSPGSWSAQEGLGASAGVSFGQSKVTGQTVSKCDPPSCGK